MDTDGTCPGYNPDDCSLPTECMTDYYCRNEYGHNYKCCYTCNQRCIQVSGKGMSLKAPNYCENVSVS